MLQIKNIKKEYRTGSLVQRALDDVSLNFRDNEFVAILGPSGSGKTTLLNIIGGLDRYDSGDLIINGISTKEYSDRDWDSYRNHTIGFVFQSYNLIAHQTILSNVELALTIGGISKDERRKKAIDALEKVGLGDQLHKKPAQMSGGQMQRVAIARALVNDPDILLADEPTGALDSETSIQVMELIKEIAEDRLVVMVTHNPELAEKYATRVVNLKDGEITSDSNPFRVDGGDGIHKNLGRASMSFATALSLSFNNLKTKLARTILVAFAGSIGIIGIALILSLSNGVNNYINSIEQDTLNEYPILINSMSMDSSAMFSDDAWIDRDAEGEVIEQKVMNTMFSMMENNDLKSLKAYLESGKSDIKTYTKAIEYDYGITPQIYRLDDSDEGYTRINPDQSYQKAGVGYSGGSVVMGAAYQTDVFHALPENEKLYKTQYEIKAGRWPEKYNECIVVLSRYGTISDLALYDLGVKDDKDFNDKLEAFANGDKIEIDKDAPADVFKYTDFIGRKYKLVNGFETFTYNGERDVWTSRSEDEVFMKDLIDKSENIEIVGVIKPKEGVKATMLQTDIYYPHELIDHLISTAKNSEIVKEQQKNRKINVLTGEKFGKEGDAGFDMGNMFSIDEGALQSAFKIDTSAFENLDTQGDVDIPTDLFSAEDIKEFLPSLTDEQIEMIIRAGTVQYNAQALQAIFAGSVNAFLAKEAAGTSSDYANLGKHVANYLKSQNAIDIMKDTFEDILQDALGSAVTQSSLQEIVEAVMDGYLDYAKNNLINASDPVTPDDLERIAKMDSINQYLQSSAAQSILSSKQQALLGGVTVSIPDSKMDELARKLADGYKAYADANNLPNPDNFARSYADYLNSPEGMGFIMIQAEALIDTKSISSALAEAFGQYTDGLATASAMIISMMMEQITDQLKESMSGMTAGFSDGFKDAFKIDPDAFANAFNVNFEEADMTNLIKSLMNATGNSYESNLQSFGYADKREPIQIKVYPFDFDSKEGIKEILDGYNEKMKKVDEDKVIIYTDFVATLMGSVTDIIDAISYVLIAFVSISLIVSSIMIGVITYISVLERKKEIGILRAIGASKRNISQVFNAETFIIGLLAGIIGIGVTVILIVPINAIIAHVTTANMRAALPAVGGVVLIILSVILTLIGGIIPSRAAAKSDPVTALRVE